MFNEHNYGDFISEHDRDGLVTNSEQDHGFVTNEECWD